ncbi:MAG: phage major capsid protein [Ruminococcaceae bacterium]|nr:phage major capsid protein [Oscillospiraceae bacterium]
MSKKMRELLAQLAKARENAATLQSKEDATLDEINAASAEIRTINAKIEAQKVLDEGIRFGEDGIEITEARRHPNEPEDRYASLEYRMAFMKFCQTGVKSPALAADTTTTTTDAGAVIPSTILNEVIKKLQVYGRIYNAVRKLNVRGGVNIPIVSLKPVATWISETTPSDRQKTDIKDSLSFAYYGLECKISTTLLTDAVTLASFESIVIDLIVEAMIKALDIAIISGSGSGSPLGITKDTRVPTANIVTLTTSDFQKWDAWKKKVMAKMPLAYKAGASWYMASGTFDGYIDGMTDANGQPIGRVNYGIAEGSPERFAGKPVIEVEDDVIKNYDDAATGDVVAILVDLKNYGLNSNLSMTMFRYLDQDKNEWVDKAILIADGKLIDPHGVIIVKKGAAA